MIEVSHTVFGFASLIFGTSVLWRQKGTRLHRTFGMAYIISMLGLNLTAFGIYQLFGGFGIFHWAALVSLASILGGCSALLLRKTFKNWLAVHYEFMVWSYIGLLAATSNEVFVHVSFFSKLETLYPMLSTASMFTVIGIGAFILYSRRISVIAKYGGASDV